MIADTKDAKAIWEDVARAAALTPEWVRDHVLKAAAERTRIMAAGAKLGE